MRTRVVITGLGAVTPIGIGIEAFWKAALASTNGVGPLTCFDTTDFRTKVGGEVKGFEASEFLSAEEQARMGRGSQFAIASARMAVRDSGLDLSKVNLRRVGVSFGTTMGEPQILEQAVRCKYGGTASDIPSGLPRQYPCGVIPVNVARALGAAGPLTMIPTACAAGNYALGYAADLVRLGRADVVVTGGSDPFSRIAFTGFNRLLATTAAKVRPFAKNRDGMAVAEGGGALVLESLDHAKARGAQIHAEVLGYGLACDAFSMTIPAPNGIGGIIALRKAVRDARIDVGEIDYVCAHGTGTGENDKIETQICKEVFGARAGEVPVSSIKSMLGHTMGAASAIEAVASVLMLTHQTLLPTINYEEPDPECDLDYVPNEPRQAALRTVVSNAYAFGGNTSTIVLRTFAG